VAPAAGLAGGTYRGNTVGFEFALVGRTVSHLSVDFNGQCPAGTATRIQIALSGPYPVQSDETFAVDEQESDGDHVKLNGTIQIGGLAAGTFELQAGGCDTGPVSWTAKRR
jgi:hypothetical protein